jgi:arylformamidase
MTDYRASFDADVSFTNGGALQVQGFRVDLPQRETSEHEIGQLFVGSLGLLMTGDVRLSNLEIVEDAHRGTRGGPSDRPAAKKPGRLVELSHVIGEGTITYPGLPSPQISPYLTREDSRGRYAPGTEFELDLITIIGNTGTYLDAPFHRYADGGDLASVTLEQTVDVPAVLVRLGDSDGYGVNADLLAPLDVTDKAVLIHTGDAARFGAPEYAQDRHYLTRDGAEYLVQHRAKLVGIDALNIDDTDDLQRPAHTLLLEAAIPVVEHLTGLEQLPPTGATFTAVPLRIERFGTIPVRAFGRIGD